MNIIFCTENGEFIIVLDSTDRENEGDLIIAAEAVTTEQMAFMIRHTRWKPLSLETLSMPPGPFFSLIRHFLTLLQLSP